STPVRLNEARAAAKSASPIAARRRRMIAWPAAHSRMPRAGSSATPLGDAHIARVVVGAGPVTRGREGDGEERAMRSGAARRRCRRRIAVLIGAALGVGPEPGRLRRQLEVAM